MCLSLRLSLGLPNEMKRLSNVECKIYHKGSNASHFQMVQVSGLGGGVLQTVEAAYHPKSELRWRHQKF